MEFKKLVELLAEIVQKSRYPGDIQDMILLRTEEFKEVEDNFKFHISNIGDVVLEFEEDKYITHVTFEKSKK